jgi:hypothetical protein
MRILVLIVTLILAGTAWAQPPRCWTNDQGVTECGTRPPPNVQTREVRTPRPATTPPEVEEAEAFADADMDEDEANRRRIMQQHCNLARETLQTYQRSDFLYERDETGNRRLLDEEETAAARAQAQRDVDERCAGLDDTADESER